MPVVTMPRTRDLSRNEYVAEMKRRGFVKQHALGFWALPSDSNYCVSDWNAPRHTNRSRLAYMVAADEKHAAHIAAMRSQ